MFMERTTLKLKISTKAHWGQPVAIVTIAECAEATALSIRDAIARDLPACEVETYKVHYTPQ